MSFISRINLRRQSSNKINPDVYQLANRGTNAILIVEQELTLVDTGHNGYSHQIADFIRQLGRSPEEISLIIITHNHVDHVGGLAEIRKFTSAKIAIHQNDIGERGNNPTVKAEDADIPLKGGEILNPLGGLEIIHTPGHTPGCISLFSPRNKLLIIGDAMR
ncbi:MBL fold metallo-hydrolase, partial [Chloroflexota bacterium]